MIAAHSAARNAGSPDSAKISRHGASRRRLDEIVGVGEHRRRGSWPAAGRTSTCRRPAARPGRPAASCGASCRGQPAVGQALAGRPARCGGSRRPSRRRTSPASLRRAPAPPSPRRRRRRPGTAQTSERWLIATAASPVAVSTVCSARGTVEIGFIAARTRSTSPVVMPPSVPPERPVTRRIAPSVADDLVVRLRAAQPGQFEAVADLDALDRLDAHQCRGQPRVEPPVALHVAAQPGRQPVRDAPRRRRRACRPPSSSASISAIIAALVAGSRQRTSDASTTSCVARARDDPGRRWSPCRCRRRG